MGRQRSQLRGGSVSPRSVEPVGAVIDVGVAEDAPEDAARLRESEAQLHLVLRAGGVALWHVDLATSEMVWSREARVLAGVPRDGPVAPGLFEQLLHSDDRAAIRRRMRRLIAEKRLQPDEMTYRLRRADSGEMRWIHEDARLICDPDGNPIRMVSAARDVTEARRAEATLIHAVRHDALTGLLNRSTLQSELAETVRRARRARASVSLLVIDLDLFRNMNDLFGHAAGDTVLRLTAACLTAVVAARGWIARLAGDGFVVVLRQETPAEARVIAEAILAALARPFRFCGVTMVLRACIGIAAYPNDASDPLTMLHYAELALDHGKKVGPSQIRHFWPGMLDTSKQRLVLVRDIGAALDAGQITPFYQPKVDLRTGAVVGFEALARWNGSPARAPTPQTFAAAFLDPYLAAAIDALMLRRVMLDLSCWHKEGVAFGRVAVNVSSPTLHTHGILEQFLRQIAIAGISPDQIQVEITESVLFDRDAQDVAALLRRFRAEGIRISLDDFGTGYASLVHLRNFPVDELKIDKGFVRNLESDKSDAAILSAVINLGRSLDIITVAEGIETSAQAARLRDWGCNLGQGFLYADAVPAAMVSGLLPGGPVGPKPPC